VRLPDHGVAFISVKDDDKEIAVRLRAVAHLALDHGYGGTATAIARSRIR